jgi:hypothetical protein
MQSLCKIKIKIVKRPAQISCPHRVCYNKLRLLGVASVKAFNIRLHLRNLVLGDWISTVVLVYTQSAWTSLLAVYGGNLLWNFHHLF